MIRLVYLSSVHRKLVRDIKREELEEKQDVQALILDIFKNSGYKTATKKEKLLIFDKDGTKKLRSIDDIVDENITICYSDVILPQSAVDIAREDGIRYYFQTSERCHKFNPHIHAEYQGEDVSIYLKDLRIEGKIKSRTKLKEIKRYVIRHREELLNKWYQYHEN